MNKITGTIDIFLSVDDAHYLNTLIDRDKAEPAIEIDDCNVLCECPACGKTIGITASFCDKCGQRIDTENFAIGARKEKI